MNISTTVYQYLECDISQDENVVDEIRGTTEANTFKINISFQPVYVQMVNGVEQLVYNSRNMELGKQYHVTWNNEEFIIIKNDNNVDFYKFFPET